MAAPEGTKFQINYKLPDGTLINLYATSVVELESGLADLAMNALNIKSTGTDLSGTPHPVVAPAVALIAQVLGGTPVAPQTYAPVAPVAPVAAGGNGCKHGAMSFKSGTSTKGPWQGWMCPTPKGAPDKCDTIWIR